jgi:hypothetical protein
MIKEKQMEEFGYRKSLLDRDNIDLFIVDDENQEIIADVLLEENGWVDTPVNSTELPKLQPWQEEILSKEITHD